MAGILLIAFAAVVLLLPAAWADECPEGGSHDYVATLVSPATDDEDGVREFTCTKCGDSFEQVIPATGHDWGPWIVDVEPTCADPGWEHRECDKHDGETHVEEREIAPLSPTGNHIWEEEWRADPTCEDEGEVHHRCQVCGEVEIEYLPALGHDWGPWREVRAATETAEGLERRECRNDASHVEERTLPVLPAPEAPGPIPEEPSSASNGESQPPPREPAASAPVQEPAQEPEPAPEADNPWAPNALDAALVTLDAVVLIVFALLAAPLLFAHAWIAARRREAQCSPMRLQKGEGGRVL